MARLLSLMAIVLALALATTARPEQPPAHAELQLAAGALSQSNSREGQAILSAQNLAPGETRSGSVTIANTGELAGAFGMSQIVTTPGALAGGLDLLVEDTSGPGAPAALYSGKLGGLGSLSLGDWSPGTLRQYRFTVSLPDDASLAGSSVAVRYDWTATADEPVLPVVPPLPDAGPPPVPAPGPGPNVGTGTGSGSAGGGDRRPPKARLTAKRRQRLLKQKRLIVLVRCDEACSLTATAKGARAMRRVRFSRWRGKAAAGKRAKVTLKLSRKARRRARKALRGRRSATVSVTVRAVDGAGNASAKRLRVRVRR